MSTRKHNGQAAQLARAATHEQAQRDAQAQARVQEIQLRIQRAQERRQMYEVVFNELEALLEGPGAEDYTEDEHAQLVNERSIAIDDLRGARGDVIDVFRNILRATALPGEYGYVEPPRVAVPTTEEVIEVTGGGGPKPS